MAVFIKIRNKFGLLISIIIFLALGLFIIQAAVNSNSSLLKGHSNSLGSINGEDVSRQDFNAELDKQTDLFALQNPKATMDDQTKFQLQDRAWNTIVNNTISQTEYDNLGILISDAEYRDMFQGTDPNPMVKQQFTNPQTGIFDPQSVANFLYRIDNDKPQTDDEAKQLSLAKAQWQSFEDEVVQNQLQGKFTNLMKKAVYIPKWQAELAYNDRATKADFQYIAIPYYSIPDSAVKITDQDLQSYVDANKEKYKQDEETRKILFVTFNVIPSSDDTIQAQKSINNIYSKLEAAPGDTNLLKENADNPDDQVYYTKDKIRSAKMKDTLFKVPVGSLIGPFFENDTNKIIKLIDRKSLPDSVKVQDIVFNLTQDESDSPKIYKKADSILHVIKSGVAVFDSMAANFSDDKVSNKKGGDIGWLKQGYTPRALNNFLFFNSKPGDMIILKLPDMQTGQWAYHLIKNVEASSPSEGVKVAYISKELVPSNTTDKDVFNKANNFSLKNNKDTLFKSAAKNQKLQVFEGSDIKQNDYQISGLGINREVVRWAYTAKNGEVSPVISSDSKYVVAIVEAINPKGVQQLSSIRVAVTLEVKKEKKAAIIAAKLAAPCYLNSTLESLASYCGQEVKKAQNATLASPYIPGIGADGKLLGTLFGLKQGDVSYPIAGDNGVYIVRVDSIESAKPIADYAMLKQQLSAQLSSTVDYGLTDAIKKTMKVEDQRYNAY